MKNKSVIKYLYSKIRRRVPGLALLVAANVAQALLAVAFALGSKGVIDSATGGNTQEFLRACLLQAAIILGILLCLTVFRHTKDRLLAELDRDWKRQLLHGLLNGEYDAVSAYHSGELLNRLNNDVRIVDEGLVGVLPNLASMICKLVAATVVLVAMEPWFALVIILAGIAVVAATALMRRSLKSLHKKVSAADGRVSGFLQETLEKLLMVQTLDVSEEMGRRADELMARRYELQRKRKNISLFANTSVSVMSYGAGFAALVWCSFGLLNGSMSFGSLTAVTQLVAQLQGPMVNLSGVIPQYVAMIAAAERLMELDAISGQAQPMQGDRDAIYRETISIRAEELKFSYDRDTILMDAALRMKKGSFAVITGPSGVGKSTLLKLMLGVFHPENGSLWLETESGVLPLDRSTRKMFAYVPQGNLLLSGTLKENLTLIRPDASEREIAQAVYVSAMEDFLPALPMGLDTVIGESGAGLSEGQAQRLAIARAVLSGAPILLLDEITSALDSDTERRVLERIKALPDRTVLAVTHRPAAIELADVQIELENLSLKVTELK